MNRAAFTLTEMLLATVLAAVLIAAVLAMLAGVSRDRRKLTAAQQQHDSSGLIERIRWDLSNASSFSQRADGQLVVFTGHGAIDQAMLLPSSRLVRVSYRIVKSQDGQKGPGTLFREQEFIDDAARPDRWRELLATNVNSLVLAGESNDAAVVVDDGTDTSQTTTRVPTRVDLRIDMSPASLERELWIK